MSQERKGELWHLVVNDSGWGNHWEPVNKTGWDGKPDPHITEMERVVDVILGGAR